ncbi:MAG: hypothetical protein QXI71_02190 [Candidatus Bathyarchaeia archaeon]|nr:hypothetical protein [Candidatus Bathyarchaeota archaeon]
MKISRIAIIDRKLDALRRFTVSKTQKLRKKLISKLEVLFNHATQMARSSDVANRDEWMRIAGYIAQVINSVADSFDEVKFNTDIKQLRVMIEAAKKRATGTREGASEADQ